MRPPSFKLKPLFRNNTNYSESDDDLTNKEANKIKQDYTTSNNNQRLFEVRIHNTIKNDDIDFFMDGKHILNLNDTSNVVIFVPEGPHRIIIKGKKINQIRDITLINEGIDFELRITQN